MAGEELGERLSQAIAGMAQTLQDTQRQLADLQGENRLLQQTIAGMQQRPASSSTMPAPAPLVDTRLLSKPSQFWNPGDLGGLVVQLQVLRRSREPTAPCDDDEGRIRVRTH